LSLDSVRAYRPVRCALRIGSPSIGVMLLGGTVRIYGERDDGNATYSATEMVGMALTTYIEAKS